MYGLIDYGSTIYADLSYHPYFEGEGGAIGGGEVHWHGIVSKDGLGGILGGGEAHFSRTLHKVAVGGALCGGTCYVTAHFSYTVKVEFAIRTLSTQFELYNDVEETV